MRSQQQLQSYQRFYRENQYLFSPFTPIDNTNDDKFHTDLILQNNKDKFQQLLKEEKNVFIRSLTHTPSLCPLIWITVIGSSINLFRNLSFPISLIGAVRLT
jgi:hypothetical protein